MNNRLLRKIAIQPQGIHQQMIFECADGWVHASVMSGLTPTKSQDAILGLDDAPDPFTFMALPADEREQFNAKRREKFKEWKRDDIVAAFQEHNHAIEAIITPDEQFAHPQLIANGMVTTVVDPIVGETTQIGSHVKLYQGVSFIARSLGAGQGLRGKKRHPTIEDGVCIYAGTTIMGGDTVIGANSTIGANVFLTKSVPPNSLVYYEEKELEIVQKRSRKVAPETDGFTE